MVMLGNLYNNTLLSVSRLPHMVPAPNSLHWNHIVEWTIIRVRVGTACSAIVLAVSSFASKQLNHTESTIVAD